MAPAGLVPVGEVDRACKLFRIAGATGWALIGERSIAWASRGRGVMELD
jgi:hypothetical protein